MFAVQRLYEGDIGDMRHKVKMMTMQIEESENLKFDIEILTDEKNMLESELTELKS